MNTLSLDLSKRLHELGVVVESTSAWLNGELREHGGALQQHINKEAPTVPAFPSPTFEELLLEVPESIDEWNFCFTRCGDETESFWRIGYIDWDSGDWMNGTEDYYGEFIPREALGQLLIWLKENGHMEVSNATRTPH